MWLLLGAGSSGDREERGKAQGMYGAAHECFPYFTL
jgi:hypothetical protein